MRRSYGNGLRQLHLFVYIGFARGAMKSECFVPNEILMSKSYVHHNLNSLRRDILRPGEWAPQKISFWASGGFVLVQQSNLI